MKRKYFTPTLSLLLLLSSCVKFDSYTYDDYWAEVYESNAKMIYEAAYEANNYAVDGVSVAMRFAILMAEMENKDMVLVDGQTDTFVQPTVDATSDDDDETEEISWDTLGTVDYNGIEDVDMFWFLLGQQDGVTVSRDGDYYTIAYSPNNTNNLLTSYWSLLDINRRNGSYKINTQGKQLLETTASTPWKVTLSGDRINFGDSYDNVEARCTYYSASLWYDGSGKFYFSYNTTIVDPDDEDEVERNWSTPGDSASVSVNNFGGSLLLDKMLDLDCAVSFYTIGENIDGYEMIYYTTTPLVYNPNDTPYGATSGAVYASLEVTSGDEYYFGEVTVKMEYLGDTNFSRDYTIGDYSFTYEYYY